MIVGGTRPELIKLARPWHELRRRYPATELWLSGQHLSLAKIGRAHV